MLYHYLKTTVRNAMKNGYFTAINVAGLAAATACCLLLALYVYHELSYDAFHVNRDRIHRVTMEFGEGENRLHTGVTGTRVMPEFLRSFPEVESGVRFYSDQSIVRYGAESFLEDRFVFADSSFFNVFTFELLEGDPATALDQPQSVVLTESVSRKYFGDASPLGKMLRVDNDKDYVVTGVMKDCPTNSQIQFRFLASFSSLEVSKTEQWWDASYYTYIMLHEGASAEVLQRKIGEHMKQYTAETGYLAYHLQPLEDVHLYAPVGNGLEPAGDYRYVYIFAGIAILILVMACANYVNLATARAADRAKEVGMRKALGAVQRQLMVQFLGESFVITSLAVLISLMFVQVSLPWFNEISGKHLDLTQLSSPFVVLALLIVLGIIGLLGGGYPALVLARFKPAATLKGGVARSGAGRSLRQVLIVTQFAITIVLIISTLIIESQLSFIRNKKLGYDTQRLVALQMDQAISDQAETFRTALTRHPGIVSMTTASRTPVQVKSNITISHLNENMLVTQIRIDREYIRTMGMALLSGSDFTEADEQYGWVSGESNPKSVIVNETLAERFGWTAQDAVGKVISLRGANVEVKGVVADFHTESMRHAITPLILYLGDYKTKMIVRLSEGDVQATMAFIQEQWSLLAPHHPFAYEFIDDEFNQLYAVETRTGQTVSIFSLLAVGLASLGLMGLVAYAAQRRVKEIGIRKVLGASVVQIATMFSGGILRPVMVAILIAMPVVWYGMSLWLNNFAYKVEVSWTVFAAGAAITLGVALLTTTIQSVKAAIANPVDALRSE